MAPSCDNYCVLYAKQQDSHRIRRFGTNIKQTQPIVVLQYTVAKYKHTKYNICFDYFSTMFQLFFYQTSAPDTRVYLLIALAADKALACPWFSSLCSTCLCRLLSSTSSQSIRPSRPGHTHKIIIKKISQGSALKV